MQIASNTTGMRAGLSFPVDKHGVEHCVVVVKGSFETDSSGELLLAEEQRALVHADEHYGDPATTCIRFESDFALEKPHSEVIVVGKAVAPRAEPVRELMVRLEVDGRAKDVLVVGDRHWTRGAAGIVATRAQPFLEMPLTYDRAFGGSDDSAVETRNLHGIGFNPHRTGSRLEGQRLPNLEHPQQRLTKPDAQLTPIGLGVLGRAYAQRVRYAGTYDQHWLDETCPFLPDDFDNRYFMSSEQDQWFPYFRGGEHIRCVHMASQPRVDYRLPPSLAMPIRFRFRERVVEREARLDTVILEPHHARAMLVWRASASVGKKLNHLRGVDVGEQLVAERSGPIAYRDGKPQFRSLGEASAWLRRRKNR